MWEYGGLSIMSCSRAKIPGAAQRSDRWEIYSGLMQGLNLSRLMEGGVHAVSRTKTVARASSLSWSYVGVRTEATFHMKERLRLWIGSRCSSGDIGNLIRAVNVFKLRGEIALLKQQER